ncbi:unnamed protein product [marine sediment metagenome]|uniref:YgjP-like metallopeptidase domain-containing protein n=1 Tax=marine sediment metagenome TaxID=412755 RepID=X1FJ10_9ZZZZ
MDYINFGTKRIDYTIKRGNRKKTLAINVTLASKVIVLAPNNFSREKIKTIVKKKALWILEKQEHFKRLTMLFPEKEFVSGEQILLLGRKYRLKIKEENDSSIPKLSGRRLFIYVHSNLVPEDRKEIIKDTLIKWYFIKSTKIIKQRITRYSKLLNLFPKKVIIKDQKKRWASCSSDGILRFNWRIAIAPISIVDYVVVHELCHLKIKNHSSDFWKLLSIAMPDYQNRRNWLKNNTGIFRL